MLTQERTTKAARITRTIAVGLRMDLSTYGLVLEVTQRKTKERLTQSFYTLKRILADFGIGVLVQKEYQPTSEVVHHVHLDKQLGDSCTCEAGVYKGQCRHVEMCREALRRGLL